MVQFNLLPDIKITYLKASRLKRLCVLVSLIVIIASFALTAFAALSVYIVQGTQIRVQDKTIRDNKAIIAEQNKKVSIDKILTVQNQLKALDTLHATKPILSRNFDYLAKLVPEQVNVSSFTVDTAAKTLTIQGSTDTIESVNKFVDTLKFAVYKSSKDNEAVPVYQNVLLTSFSRDKAGASYAVSMLYDEAIFNGMNDAAGLIVPNKITTRSELERPIFQTEAEKTNNVPDTTKATP